MHVIKQISDMLYLQDTYTIIHFVVDYINTTIV